MADNILVYGKIIKCMEKDNIDGQMAIFIKDNMKIR